MALPLSRISAVLASLVLLQGSDFSCSTGDSLGVGVGVGGIRVSGVVHFLEIEGGCWQLRGDNGSQYELRPAQAPPKMLVDGARVSVILDLRTDLASVCQVGQIADVDDVESIRLP